MPAITNRSGFAVVRLPVLRSVATPDGRILVQVAGSRLVPVADAQGLYIGPDGYTSDQTKAQSFATSSNESITVESPGAPGKSTYQSWLEQGNEGDVAAFLLAMMGRPGKDVTPEQIAQASSDYFALHPVKDGKDATAAQVAQGAATYLAANPAVTPEQLAAAVNAAYSANPPKDGKSVEMRATETAIQWRQVGGTWVDLVQLSALKGPSALVQLPDATIKESALLALNAGIRTVSITNVTGLQPGDTVVITPKADLPNGYALHNAWCTTAGTLKVALTAPLLAIGASYAIIVKVVALR